MRVVTTESMRVSALYTPDCPAWGGLAGLKLAIQLQLLSP